MEMARGLTEAKAQVVGMSNMGSRYSNKSSDNQNSWTAAIFAPVQTATEIYAEHRDFEMKVRV